MRGYTTSRKTLYFLLICLIYLIVGEVTARVYFHIKKISSLRDKVESESKIRKMYEADYLPDFAKLQNYRFINLYVPNPGLINSPDIHFDQFGFRMDRHKLSLNSKLPYKFIWIFGGSTAQGLGVKEDDTIPAHLNNLLEASGSEWRALNLGIGGYTSTMEMLLLFELLQRGFKPDAILTYDGINERKLSESTGHEMSGLPGWEISTGQSSLVTRMQRGEEISPIGFRSILDQFSALYRAILHIRSKISLHSKDAATH